MIPKNIITKITEITGAFLPLDCTLYSPAVAAIIEDTPDDKPP
jgi:hypothetical protein